MSDTETQSSIEAIAGSAGVDACEVHAAFADERRTTTMRALAGRPTPVDVATLARAVAQREVDDADEFVPDSRVEQIHVELRHVYLPKLEQLGLVAFDADAGVVTDYPDGLESLTF